MKISEDRDETDINTVYAKEEHYKGHGITNYIDNKGKCRHQKNLPGKGLCGRCLSV
jgi:hypothetical protein